MQRLLILLLCVCLAACSLAPNYQQPDTAQVMHYKEANAELS